MATLNEYHLNQLQMIRHELHAFQRDLPMDLHRQVLLELRDIYQKLNAVEESIKNPLTAPHIGGDQHVHGD